MSYNYQTEKAFIFTEDGQVMFLKIRDHIKNLLKVAGCFTSGKAMNDIPGDVWSKMACIDRLVELGEIVEVIQESVPAGQNRIFIEK
jgi:hypothetical protein